MEMDSLLNSILKTWGYDFTAYAKASLKRRLDGFLVKNQLQNYRQLEDRLVQDKCLFSELLKELSINVTELFRDPGFYQTFRTQVVPILKTYPFIKIWHAGCATGEEVYSIAILLYEEGFLSKATIYGTDFNLAVLEKAKNAIYDVRYLKQYQENYILAGGKAALSDYYYSNYNAIKLHDFLKKRVTFAHHNLVTDQVFGEMNVILCRNVLIYFDRHLQNRVLTLFRNSLCHRGFLCLGMKESLDFTVIEKEFDSYCREEKIYRYAK